MRRMSILWLIAIASLGGCATVGPDLTQNGEVSVQRSSSKLVTIQAVTVQQDGQQLVVSGVVRRVPSSNTPIWGHVNVTAFDAAGQTLGHAVVRYSPPSLPQKGPRSSQFTARVAAQAMQGTIVRIEHHTGGHGRDECPPLNSVQ